MDKKAVTMEELKLMLERISELDSYHQVFGAEKHQYKSYPLSNAELERLERELGVRLPEAYRQFLRVIGYGAGPYYGLLSPDEILEALSEFCFVGDERRPIPSQPFPLSRAHADECYQIMSERREALCQTDWPTDGYVPICFEGCTSYTMLVTAGELAGTVWSCNVDEALWNLAPQPPDLVRYVGYPPPPDFERWETALSPEPTFLEWYRPWLEQCLSDQAELKRQQPQFWPYIQTGQAAGGLAAQWSTEAARGKRLFCRIVDKLRKKGWVQNP